MNDSTRSRNRLAWLSFVPPARWLARYRAAWLPADAVAGVTLAAYAIPVSLAYAGLAGLPPQVGVYGYLLGGLGYALLGSSRQLAIGPTSAISLMIAGTVGAMADGDANRYAQIASLTAWTVAVLCLIAWLLRCIWPCRVFPRSLPPRCSYPGSCRRANTGQSRGRGRVLHQAVLSVAAVRSTGDRRRTLLLSLHAGAEQYPP
jgi:hypothetical protein